MNESVFSKMDKKARYKGISKNQFQAYMQAMVYNFKKLIKYGCIPIFT